MTRPAPKHETFIVKEKVFTMNRFRFAPSPTGHLHIGGARTALYNYLLAQKTKGKFILRIEDTDRERSTQGHIDAILEAMQWLGLNYDEGPFYQTERYELYQQHLQKLLDQGKAYRCFCSPEELDSKRQAAMQAGKKPKYDGTCRNLDPQQSAQETRPHCIRFLSPDEGVTVVEDLIKGHIEFNNQELDDLIIARTDGTPTYNFVVVVDDVTMQISHVIRGDDHLNNTPRQVQLYQALDYPTPQFAHIPMILGSDKKRLSKRHGATSVLAYRDEGYLPEALLNYLVRLGWSHGDEEVFSMDQLKEYFNIEKVGKAAAIFNPEKLLWLNAHWIRQSSPERLIEASKNFFQQKNIALENNPYTQKALASCQEKVKTLVDLANMAVFYFLEEIEIEEKARNKQLTLENLETLKKLLPQLLALPDLSEAQVNDCFQKFGEEHQLKLGKIAGPLRVALSGSMVSPGIFEMIEILGKERIQARIENLFF